MFIIFLLLSEIRCEWVEISQNHYKKEPVHEFTLNFEHTTKANQVYRNVSIAEQQWKRGSVDRVTNVGNIKRVQFPSVKTTSLKSRYEEYELGENANGDLSDNKHDFTTLKSNKYKFNTYNDDVIDIQNKDTNYNTRTIIEDVNRHKKIQADNSKLTKVLEKGSVNLNRRLIFHEKGTQQTSKGIDNGNQVADIRKVSLQESDDKFNDHENLYAEKSEYQRVSHNDEINFTKNSENRPFNSYIKKQAHISKIKFVHKNENFADLQNFENDNEKQKISNNTNSEVSGYPSPKKHDNFETTATPHLVNDYFDSKNEFKHSISPGYSDENFNTNKFIKPEDINPKTHLSGHKVEMVQSKDNRETTFSKSEDISNGTKGNTVKEMWELMKVVTNTIYKNTHRSYSSKIKYLENLKVTILSSIKDQIDRAWPDDVQSPSRRARSAHARGHLEFPSSESTLMTISFLTFAVFLVKLVLQVIHTYKNKTMMVTPAVVAAVGRAAAVIKSHQ